MESWQTLDRILTLETRWFTLIGEHLQDHQGIVREYWRVERVDSVIVIPIQRDRIILPVPMYRPGIGELTWDFPGGRCPVNQSPAEVVEAILARELDLQTPAVEHLIALTPETGWAINSSFSNQKLYGFVAQLKPDLAIPAERLAGTYANNSEGFQALLAMIQCAQCRLVLREWQERYQRYQRQEFSNL